jgi:hypothetical protein
LIVAAGVAGAYASALLGAHRVNVFRMRRLAGGFPTLRWLDWDALLDGLLPKGPSTAVQSPAPAEGGPSPLILAQVPEAAAERHALLCAIVKGHPIDAARFEPAGFSGGEAKWLSKLTRLRSAPEDVLIELEDERESTAAGVYLREHLFLQRRTGLLNLELAVFASKRRLKTALERYSDAPSLHFVRALASAQMGFNSQVLDDLGRAVYFSKQSPFYLRAVVELPFVAEARPALHQQCRAILQSRGGAAAVGAATIP